MLTRRAPGVGLAGAEKALAPAPADCVDLGTVPCNRSVYDIHGLYVMRAIRGCRHYFFVQLGAWDPWAPRQPGAPGRKTPRGTPPGGQGPLPPEGTKWFDFDITGHQRRKHRHGLVDRNAPRAAPRIWLRLCEGDRFDPTGFSYDAEFWLRRGSTPLAPAAQCRHAHVAHVPVGGGVADEPQEERERCVSVSESSPLQGGPWQGTCPPCAQGFQDLGELGAAGSKRLPFHVSRKKQGRGAETRAAGRRRIWDLAATVHAVCQSVPFSLPVFLCSCVTARPRRT